MRELPLLLNSEMVRAVLDGRKTQTRKPLKPQPRVDGTTFLGFDDGEVMFDEDHPVKMPHQVGDKLYVRERARVIDWRPDLLTGGKGKIIVRYESDGTESGWIVVPNRIKLPKLGHCLSNGCFKEAARLWLPVTGVRCERWQDISIEDTHAEGLRNTGDGWGPEGRLGSKAGFRDIINSLYPGSWARNDWVFITEFKLEGK